MVSSKARSAEAYLNSLPADRKDAISEVRKVILKNLPRGFEETMDFGMLTYVIPLSRFRDTYNGHPVGVAALASQKNYMSVYLMCNYGDTKMLDWFTKAYKASGKRLDMGKVCIRFRRLEDLALDVIGEAVNKLTPEQVIAIHEKVHGKKKRNQ